MIPGPVLVTLIVVSLRIGDEATSSCFVMARRCRGDAGGFFIESTLCCGTLNLTPAISSCSESRDPSMSAQAPAGFR